MEQLARAERYLTKLYYAYEGIQASSATFSIDQPKDDCISFFMHCYHVKDWLIALHGNKQQTEDFINSNEELRICADICNGAKHYKITGELRSGSHQKVEVATLKSSTWITGSGGIEVHQCKFSVISESKTYDALQLAIKCMELWKFYVATIKA
jgi:hypothetical protein